MSNFVKIVTFVPRKFWNYTKSINVLLEAPTGIKESADKSFTYISKVVGATTGSCGLAKGTSDAIEAFVCQDGICFVVSCVGVGADTLQILTSFVPGPNVTSIVTIPVSYGCKFFVWCCKRNSVPWMGGC